MRRALASWLAVLLIVPCASHAQAPPSDPEVVKGIREVQDNELDAAIFTLDTAARRLAGDPAMARELARAYLYLGIAFIGKTQEALAKARFRDALQQQRDLSLSEDQFSPKVIALFESVRNEVGRQPAAPAAVPTPAAATTKPVTVKGSSKTPLIVAGVAGVGALATVVAVGGGGSEATTTTPTSTSPGSSADTRQSRTFGPEVLAMGARREFDIVPTASGTLEAQVSWTEPGANLVLYLDEATGGISIAVSDRSVAAGTRFKQISAPVTAKAYKIGVFHCIAGCQGTPQSTSDATFTVQVKVP